MFARAFIFAYGLASYAVFLVSFPYAVGFVGGRPAPCRPDLFRSGVPRLFPLTDEETRQLRAMYPGG
jgi:hypothetical protein